MQRVKEPRIQRPADERLLLVDGHAYAYRAWHAIRDLRAPDGRPTNALYGFIRAVEKLRQNLRPSHAAVLWDGGLAADRLEALPEYKAQRPEMPEGLRVQLDPIVTWLRAAGIASGCRPGVEADDWIATLACWGRSQGWEVVIASSDKDFMQLVAPGIGLVQPHDPSGQIWTDQQVREKTGVEPAQVVDWLSLVGDASDNIPGVPGIGPKTAAALLSRFGSAESLLNHLDEVQPVRLRAALRESVDLIRRNQELVRLRTDLPVGFEPPELLLRPPDLGTLRSLYRRWGFRSLLESMDFGGSETPERDLFDPRAPVCQHDTAARAGEKVDKASHHC